MSKSLQAAFAMGAELCRVAGLDPERVAEITLRCSALEPVTIEAKVFPEADGMPKVEAVLRKYEVVERND